MFVIKNGKTVVKSGIKTYQKALQLAYELAMPEVPVQNLTKKQVNSLNFVIEEV
jgi:hypothetical protein